MVKSVASEQHCCLSVERPLLCNHTFTLFQTRFPWGDLGPPENLFWAFGSPFYTQGNWKLGVAEVNGVWKIINYHFQDIWLNFVTSGKNFSAWNWKLGFAEVNISPKIPTSAQPLKMALHKYGCWLHGCWIIFLHKSKKNSFFAWLKDFFLHHSKGNLLNLPFKTYGVVLQPCVARSIARLLCMH